VSAVVGIVLLAALAAWALSSGPASTHKARTTTTTTAATTTTTAPTTTTTQVTTASAASALVSDVQQGEASGAIPASLGHTVLDQLGQALAASANGNTDQVSSALGSIDQAVSDASANGNITAQEASTLLTDVATLAGTLGVQNPASTTTTTAPPPPGGGDGGHGGGGGH
jgi:hypothetical protein